MSKTDHFTWDKFVPLLETHNSRAFSHPGDCGLHSLGKTWTDPATGQGMDGENSCFQVIGITVPILS
jgi:hypothetical protein